MMGVFNKEKVCILLSTYNGEKYLAEQLQSLYSQEGVDISIVVRDDGSSDVTCALLDKEQEAGRLTWYSGENLKPALSFWNLLQHAPDSAFYAFCDQDDVWDKDKLKAAVGRLEQAGDAPALYFSRPRLVDSSLNELPGADITPLLTYEESLIYHFVTGCTMVINDAMRRVLLGYTPSYMRMHDLWAYVVAQAVGAEIYYDHVPHVSYRQHANNVVGLDNSFRSVWKKRLERVMRHECIRSKIAKELLAGYAGYMTPEKLKHTSMVVGYRSSFAAWMKLLFSPWLKCASSSVNLSARLSVLFRML